jgi:hypothetical protein
MNDDNVRGVALAPISLQGDQLVAARAIALIELKLTGRVDEDADPIVSEIVTKLEGDYLQFVRHWRSRAPLWQIYDFTSQEINLLLDLSDAGGVKVSRADDDRYQSIGSGLGGKKAVVQSYGSEGASIRLSSRGKDLVEYLKGEGYS